MSSLQLFLITVQIFSFYGHNIIVGDDSKGNVCISNKRETISALYEARIYDPRHEDEENPMYCQNRRIWLSSDGIHVIYYQPEFNRYGIFQCGAGSYLFALNAQPMDIASENMCVDPKDVYPDSYPASQCEGQPLVYCLPSMNADNCPSLIDESDQAKDIFTVTDDLALENIEMYHFYDCQCWYESNGEDKNQQITLSMDFNEDCWESQEQERVKEIEEEQDILSFGKEHHKFGVSPAKDKEDPADFTELWASLGFMIGFVVLVIFAIYMCRERYSKRMYLSSRTFYRNVHYGEIENDDLLDDSSGLESETESAGDDGSSEYDSDTDLSLELDYRDTAIEMVTH